MKKAFFQTTSPKIILGVDPGTRVCGYGVIAVEDQQLTPIDYGCICPPVNLKLSDRYLIIFNGLEELIETHKPSITVVETQYVYKNIQSAIKLGMARGAALVAAKRKGLLVFEYAPTEAKRAVVGSGRASKLQVQEMIQTLLHLRSLPREDAADALALAICHAHSPDYLNEKNEI